MSEQEKTIMDMQIKGFTVRLFWQIFAGYTSLICTVLFTYFSLKTQIRDKDLEQAKIDAIQDLRLDGMKRDIELQNLQIKDLNERYNELKSK